MTQQLPVQCRGQTVEHVLAVLIADVQEAVEVTQLRPPPSLRPRIQIYTECGEEQGDTRGVWGIGMDHGPGLCDMLRDQCHGSRML